MRMISRERPKIWKRFNAYDSKFSTSSWKKGLASSVLTGKDEDAFDATCDHLFVRHRASGSIVGTYRMQTAEKADKGIGFYASNEFDLSVLPDDVRCSSVEIGRACIHKDHRSLNVL